MPVFTCKSTWHVCVTSPGFNIRAYRQPTGSKIDCEHSLHFHLVAWSTGIWETRIWRETAPNGSSFSSAILVSIRLQDNTEKSVTDTPRFHTPVPIWFRVYRQSKRQSLTKSRCFGTWVANVPSSRAKRNQSNSLIPFFRYFCQPWRNESWLHKSSVRGLKHTNNQYH